MTPRLISPDTNASRFWFRYWLCISCAAAFISTILDVLLLQRQHGFFTGGFLSEVHAKGTVEILAFVLISLFTDAAIMGVLVSLGLWLSSFIRLRGMVRTLMVLGMAASPVFVTDFFRYEVSSYIGDLFSLLTMFQLTGKSVLEILAVVFPHLIVYSLTILGIAALLFSGLWVLNRQPSGASTQILKMPVRSILLRASVLFFLGLGSSSFARMESEVFDQGLRKKPSGLLLGNIMAFISDFDRDGYGLLTVPVDPDPFDANVFPYAIEIPGNGIDENGVGGDLPLEKLHYSENTPHEKAWTYKPDIVFIMLESFRADLIDRTHKGKQITPILNRLASHGISSKHAYSHNGYTIQSRRHVFSGSLANLRSDSLIDDFKLNGYEVSYFSGQDESFGGPKMGSGFERADIAYDARVDPDRRYTTFSSPGSIGLPFSFLQEKVTTFLETRSSTKPLLLYVNFIDTHFPYYHDQVVPLISKRVLKRVQIGPDHVAALQAMYFNTAANIDRAIGKVIEKVRDVTNHAPSIIVTSDHGESLFDGGFLGHGYLINDVQTRIPLIVSNLPMIIEEPFGQSSLRKALTTALVHLPADRQKPVLKTDPSKKVFQYTGDMLHHPGQIALTGLNNQIVYRFKTGRVQINQGDWKKPAKLAPASFQNFLELIHLWERMVLAQEERKGRL